MCELKIFLVTSSHFQASSHFCNQNTFNFLGLTSLNFACWSSINFFFQNTHWNKYLMLSEQQRDNKKTCFVKGWDVTLKQNAGGQNSTTKWLTIQHHSWISFSGNICALPKNFDLLSIWWCSGENMVENIIFHKLNSLLANHHLVSILENFATIQMNGPKPHHDIHISCLDYTT